MLNELNKMSISKATNEQEMLKAIKELTELNEVLIKGVNKDLDEDSLIDEIADVEIMIDRLKYRFDIKLKVTHRIFEKVSRQLKRWAWNQN